MQLRVISGTREQRDTKTGLIRTNHSMGLFIQSGRSILVALVAAGLSTGCLSVKTHSTIDPIYMTLDVNLKVQLQKELNDAFGAIDAASDTMVETAPDKS